MRSDETEKRVQLSEIDVLIFESTAVSLTAYLLNELLLNNVKVVFCTFNHNPFAELVPYSGCHNQVASLREQLGWSDEVKGRVWQKVVQHKITNQAKNLQFAGFDDEAEMLLNFAKDVHPHDETNREGHSAKVYFNRIFRPGFVRHTSDTINHALDYGYAVLLSLVNREIVANGFLTQLGIHHDSQFNHFNFGCDLMEPFRPVVDRWVLRAKYDKFETEEKHDLVNFLQVQLKYKGAKHYLPNVVETYCRSVFKALSEGNTDKVENFKQIRLEEKSQ